jgi:hypothetical protein
MQPPKEVKLTDIAYGGRRHVLLSDKGHVEKCDVNPVDLTWRRRFLPGVKNWVCQSCYERILRKYGSDE